MRGPMRLGWTGRLVLCASIFGAAAPCAAQGSYSPYNETATAALTRYVRELTQDPKNFEVLIRAGRAALELGDTGAAAGFFARADEVNPRSPLPHSGMGAVYVAQGDAYAALPYFSRAQQLGAPLASFGADRGLAYDLLGRQAEAQADYRAAMAGADRDTAIARLALSLAISGNRAEALSALAPLMAKGDPAGARARAFVLALTGDSAGARSAIDVALPGSAAQVAPFLARLSALNAAQKAAAVNLGLFPDSSGVAYASATPVIPQRAPSAAPSVTAIGGTVATSRLADLDALLRSDPVGSAPAPAAAAPSIVQTSPAPVQVASVAQTQPSTQRASKIWLQLASGRDADALPDQFHRLKSRYETIFDGIRGYVAKAPDRARLVIGPFHSASDADTFAADLESVHVNAFKWKNSASDTIVPLGTD